MQVGYSPTGSTEAVEIEIAQCLPKVLEVVFNILHIKHETICYNLNIPCDRLYKLTKVPNAYCLNMTLGF